MVQKIVKYINELEDKKEQKRNALEKYKDHLGAIASVCTIVTVLITLITVLVQYQYSNQAAQFYNIDQMYFFQESVWKILYKAGERIVALIFEIASPFIAYKILHQSTKENKVFFSEKTCCSNFALVLVEDCLPYLVYFMFYIIYCSISSFLFLFELGDIFAHFHMEYVSVFYLVLVWIFLLTLIMDIENRIKIWDQILCIFIIVILGLYGIGFFESNEELRENVTLHIYFSIFILYYFLVYFLLKYRQENNIVLVIMLSLILGGLLLVPYSEILRSFTINPYTQKKDYEIIQKISSFNLDNLEEQTKLDSKFQNEYEKTEINCRKEQDIGDSIFQVVILHRGSQVLLMNGKIDGNDTINPLEDMSSSNLVIDISSYEFQEASQYRFYRKEFKNVTTNAPENNDKQGE